MSYCLSLLLVGAFGLSGVLLGALGAHALHHTLDARGMLGVWQTAVLYQFVHVLALMAVTLRREPEPNRRLAWAMRGWTLGIVLFSGSLYCLALGGPAKIIGPVTPLGGLAFLFGWGCLLVEAWRGGRTPRPGG